MQKHCTPKPRQLKQTVGFSSAIPAPKWLMSLLFGLTLASGAFAAPRFQPQLIFESPASDPQFHAHASSLVECPNGDLLAVWYENGTILPAPYYSERRDKSDDVHIGGSRLPKGATKWDPRFVAADTFGVSDNNPCMVIDKEQRLWLFYPTLIGVPKWAWGSAIVRYAISTDYQKPGAPVWAKQNILIPKVEGIKEVVESSFAKRTEGTDLPKERIEQYRTAIMKQFENVAYERMGWMPRAHPLVRSDGAIVLPFSNENFDVAAMAFTKDGGDTWTYSKPVPESGVTQPTVVEYPDKTMTAFFRNGSPQHRIRRSESTDGGVTWAPLTVTDLLHPGAGIEALLLANGNLLMMYNDVEKAPRNKLAVSISADRGKTWQWTRHIESTPDGRFDYPSVIQAKDGTLHATYTVGTKTIKYVHFNEEWVKAGDAK